MKTLLSRLSGRLLTLLVPATLVASLAAPSNVLAFVEMSQGGGVGGGDEGDPLDTNDYGGGGGDGSDVHDNHTVTAPVKYPWGISLNHVRVLLVPELVGETLIFKILIIDAVDPGLTTSEGIHAP